MGNKPSTPAPTPAPTPRPNPDELCSLPSSSLQVAGAQYPELSAAVQKMQKHPIAVWYTDRESVESYKKKVSDIRAHCSESTRMTLVVYGLPNKDCEAGYANGGLNQNAADYKNWVQTLYDGVGQRKVLYVVEPDALGMLAHGGCALASGYGENVKAAISILSQNPNADIYLDVGYWTLLTAADAASIAKTVKSVAAGGRIKGVTLNTSNYRSNKQMAELCTTFQKAYGDSSLNCIVDTSRNYNSNPPNREWCNANFGGVGIPPTGSTGYSNLDYYVWVKPAGDSDGTCDSKSLSSYAMKGPASGLFFKDNFVTLWNNGYFVKEKQFPAISSKPSNLQSVGVAFSSSEASTPSGGGVSDGSGGGVLAAVVIAAVLAVGVAAVAWRRHSKRRSRADSARTPVEEYAMVNATPAQVTIL